MAQVHWIKIATTIFEDEKIRLIENMHDGQRLVLVWIKLLCLAGKLNNGGVFTLNAGGYSPKMLATLFNMRESMVKKALNVFEEFGLTATVDGVLTIPNWNKHQNVEGLDRIRAQHRERQKKYAERKKAQACADGSADVCLTPPDAADIESEIEKESERESDPIPSYPSLPQEIVREQTYDAMGCDGISHRKLIYDRVADKIQWTYVSYQGVTREMFDQVVGLITDTLCSTRPTIRISGEDIPADVVRERLESIDGDHLVYVAACMEQQSTPIRNIRQYLLAALYNAPMTIRSYYDNRVAADAARRDSQRDAPQPRPEPTAGEEAAYREYMRGLYEEYVANRDVV